MSEIVGGFGVPHNPHFPSWSESGAPLGPEIDRLYGEVASSLRAVHPEVLIVFTSDHYNIFFERSLPIFSIGVAEAAEGPSDYDTIPRRRIPIASELAREIQREVVAADFDLGMSQEFEFDHTVVAPLHFLWPEHQIEVIPIFISAFIRPIASARRCWALGGAVRQALEASPDPRRIAVVASGSFSVEIGGPRLAPDSHVGVPDPGWTERVVELLAAGEFKTLVSEATDERLLGAGNAAAELLDWIAMLAMIEPTPAAFIESQPQFGHAYASWPASRGRP